MPLLRSRNRRIPSFSLTYEAIQNISTWICLCDTEWVARGPWEMTLVYLRAILIDAAALRLYPRRWRSLKQSTLIARLANSPGLAHDDSWDWNLLWKYSMHSVWSPAYVWKIINLGRSTWDSFMFIITNRNTYRGHAAVQREHGNKKERV